MKRKTKLLDVLNNAGKVGFPPIYFQDNFKTVNYAVKRGFLAGNYSKPYLTDKGDTFLENNGFRRWFF